MLPRPGDAAERTARRVRELSRETAPRLLFVSSVASGLVTLKEADGTVIDEPIAWIGSLLPQAGDAVVAIQIPGRGDKHAAGTRVALGPVNRTVPAATIETTGDPPTIAFGTGAGAGAVANTIQGNDATGRVIFTTGTEPLTSGTILTVNFAVPRATINYAVALTAADDDMQGAMKSTTYYDDLTRTVNGWSIVTGASPLPASRSHRFTYVVTGWS